MQKRSNHQNRADEARLILVVLSALRKRGENAALSGECLLRKKRGENQALETDSAPAKPGLAAQRRIMPLIIKILWGRIELCF